MAHLPFRSAAMIVNAKSRSGQRAFAKACRSMEGLPFPVDAHAVENPSDLDDVIKSALGRKPDLLVLGGGDGTISGLVDHLVDQDIVLGLLPLGTANSFCRTLDIPLDVAGAVEVIRNGRPRRIDLGMIDDDYFANCAAMGLSPSVAETVPHLLKKILGRVGYLGWAAYRFGRFKPFTLIVSENGRETRVCVVEVRISNGRFHGGTELVESAAVDSGEIVVQAVVGNSKFELIRNWGASMLRLESRRDDTRAFRGRSFRIVTEPPMLISIDGEVLARTPVTASIAAGAIEVMVPSTGRPERSRPLAIN